MAIFRALLTSKKAVMTVLGIITTYLLLPFLNGRLGLGLDASTLNEAIYPFVAYLLAQGAADFRKESAKSIGAGYSVLAPVKEKTNPPADSGADPEVPR